MSGIVRIRRKAAAVFWVGLFVYLTIPAQAETTEPIARGSIPSDAVDKAGETIGAIGSGLAYDPKENILFAISDRGPGDGTIDYCPRFDVLRLTQSPENKAKLNIEVIKTIHGDPHRIIVRANPRFSNISDMFYRFSSEHCHKTTESLEVIHIPRTSGN